MAKHEFTKVRQDVVRRTVRVVQKQQITPRMLRILFQSEEMAGFLSPSPDDHIKIFLPSANSDLVGRDFTPRAWDSHRNTLTLDFALHPHGPAVEWAQGARIGDTLEIGGPRGSTVIPDDFAWYLLIGDATALPSIGRRLEHLTGRADVHVLVLLDSPDEKPYLAHATEQQLNFICSERDQNRDAIKLVEALNRMILPRGDGFVWIAAEAGTARTLYRHALDDMRHPAEWIKAAGYWSSSKADGGERIA